MKKKLLFVVDERQMGGVSTVLNDLLNLLDISSYAIDVLVLHNRGDQLNDLPKEVNLRFGTSYFSGIDFTIKDAIKSGNLKTMYYKTKIVFSMKTKKVIQEIRRERKQMNLPVYDVEIAFKDGFTALFTSAGNAKYKIHWLHYEYHECNPNQKYHELFLETLEKFDKIVGVSKNVLLAFNKIYHLESKSVVIPNVINETRIKELAMQDVNVNLNKNKINLISVGRLHNVKAYDRLIKIVSELGSQYIEKLHIDIYGDGPEFELLKKDISDKNLEEVIFLCGKTDNPYAIMKHYDGNLVPSRFEAFGLSIVESMLVEVPVLSTKTAAVEELIDSGVNGIICENSEKGIYEMLKMICQNPKLLIDMKKKLIGYQYNNEEIMNDVKCLFNGGNK